MPSREVLKRLMVVLNDGNDFSTVLWGNSGEIFTRSDLTLLFSVLGFVEELMRSISLEKEIMKNGENPPAGLPDLGRLESCQSFYDLLWHSQVNFNRVNIIPSDVPSSKARIEADNLNNENIIRCNNSFNWNYNNVKHYKLSGMNFFLYLKVLRCFDI